MRLARRVLPLAASLAALALAAPAGAIPSDPPVAPLTPADGATLATDQAGITVTFACPAYNQDAPQTLGGITFTFLGSAADYFVDFATAARLGTDGRIGESARIDLATAQTSNELPVGTCRATMKSDQAVPGAEITPGGYHWQVVRTLSSCLGCPPRYEAGPVRSFTLRNDVTLTVARPSAVYSGYDHRFQLGAVGVPDGVDVVLERRRGRGWTAIGRGAARGERAAAIARLPRARQTVRVAFELGGQRSYGAPRAVVVRDGRTARRLTTRRDDGAWAGRADGAPEASSFRVVDGGREIRDLRLPVLLGCPNPGPTGGTILLRSPGVIRIGRIRVAPDGRFAKVQPDRAGVADVSGRLLRGRLSEGTVGLARGECTITGGWSGAKRR
ncbi:hypothetical protein Q5424_23685 [Conexibacter sp. JD483]|uniref:hypothetical protein n=1 Tax=unclassified Conexibacter TaxID=2627773 RepID=UPI0027182BE4|nr:MULTISPECIES: hypothetical protein [unclassified Conexibacter]MDO8189246.1 hypothetical protein [Conexibacter sp. CPCC 205706]MDO8198732.1 hypothetical protein [Conexibacter sp. CPCC 205762]MDR9372119.1 hypothetical protein [Conexibacter sp. JD483]